ncbi:MAG: CPBP family intramembrane metalloprotease [Acidobacteria bacterium]|nr:CPBP family intramembrane metalloprotease [Acidobacteriota bacterium]
MAVRIERGLAMPAGKVAEQTAGTIFLDGAAQGPPVKDRHRHLYNLDHHEGCVRAFTLASCEQAMVLILEETDFRLRDWTLFANDPDLDTVLAIWVLLNHVRLSSDAEIRRRVMPLLRLQGVIDAHGLGFEEFCGFPEGLESRTRAKIERLRAEEVEIKQRGGWDELDFASYTAGRLQKIDELVYLTRHFRDVVEVEELARARLANGCLAIACRSEEGIYEVEQRLQELHGDRVGVIALEKAPGVYTLRQVDSSLAADLKVAYDELNLIDSAAGWKSSGDRWGGSAEIGGSPRKSGTRLDPQQIVATLRRTYTPVGLWQRAVSVVRAALGPALVLVSIWGWSLIRREAPSRLFELAAVLLMVALTLLALASRSLPGLFGIRRPRRWRWLRWFLPAAVVAPLGGVANLTWFEAGTTSVPPTLATLLAIAATGAGLEVLLRGVAYGVMARDFPIQEKVGRSFLSWPVVFSSALYVLLAATPLSPFVPFGAGSTAMLILAAVSAAVFGLSAGLVRERSESLGPCIALHWLCSALALFFA